MSKLFTVPEEMLKRIEVFQQWVANGALLFMMAIITIDVIGRNFFHNPLKGTYEMTELSSALLVFFALAVTHRVGDHITIDFLVERFSEKLRNLILAAVEMIISIVLFLMATNIFDNGLRMMERHSTTTDLAIPLYPFLFLIALTLMVFMFTAIFKAITYIRLVVKKS
ncbi:TRAP transporter small permease [Ornithinibacillus scapharcae]|uniref:TRAP transporter small permease n=1 Tax=Ornithinibacillus scapharcae TaxID=1147159 RepID=UPI000225BB74|nr:TRAP transporter small permease [Ornithinibacillus scapharcae]